MRKIGHQLPNLEFPVNGSRAVYEQYRRLAAIALDMQTRGLRIDRAAVAAHRERAEKRQRRFRELWVTLTGVTDIGEDGQTAAVKAWFWETKECDPKISLDKKTRRPKLDTNGALMHWLVEDPRAEVRKAAAALIGYRKAAKALGFCAAYEVPRIHPMWNVTGTKGSRWSCSGPNLQQLPSKTVKYDFGFGDGPEVLAECMKDIILPEEGYVFVGADYVALELYLQTYLARAQRLMGWITAGQDLHLGNARIFFGEVRVPLTATKTSHKAERTVAKSAYGFSYASTDHVKTTFKTMKGALPEVTEAWVKEARRRYFAAHPEFPRWQEETKAAVTRDGFIETPLMRRRLYLEASRRGFDTALNAQCQITGGDMVHLALLELAPQFLISINGHDAITGQVRAEPAEIRRAAEALKAAMEGPFPIAGLDARFAVEPDCGPNYRDMVDAAKYY